MKRLAAVIMLVLTAAGIARAEQPVYEYRAKDQGETPVIIYIEGSAWNIGQTIYTNEKYSDMNMLVIRSKTAKYDMSACWKAEDRKLAADSIVKTMLEHFPKADKVINIIFSLGGCMAEEVFSSCEAHGIRTICAVMLDSVFRKYPPEGMEAAGIPIMYAISGTNIEKHVTGWTRNWLRETGAPATEYDVTHGELETDRKVQEDVLQFIAGV